MTRTYRVRLEWDKEDGGWVVTVPALPGCVTQGDTESEALAHAAEAMRGHVAALADAGEPIPPGDADGPAVTVVISDPASR